MCAGPLLTFLLILPLQSNTGGKILWRYFIQRYHNDEVFYIISATKSTKSGQIKGLTCQCYVNVLANLESQMQKKHVLVNGFGVGGEEVIRLSSNPFSFLLYCLFSFFVCD